MQQNLLKEITPLTINDCFTVFSRTKKEFNFPLHFHEEYELNLIINAKGAKRIIGDHMSEINDIELVLIGPNLPHCWKTFNCKSKKIIEITIQFHKDLIDEKFLTAFFSITEVSLGFIELCSPLKFLSLINSFKPFSKAIEIILSGPSSFCFSGSVRVKILFPTEK